MQLILAPYRMQHQRWPHTGRHILAQFDAHTIVVYQAYNPTIGHYAVTHGRFGGAFSFNRMSWIKPNFLWMMYRSGWGTQAGQEVVLAIWLKRPAFDAILEQAVHSAFAPGVYANERLWQQAVAASTVRLQWDPDHAPAGAKMERRAIQLGLRGETLHRYATEWIVHIEDISAFVAEQRIHAQPKTAYNELLTPQEQVYPVASSDVTARLEVSSYEGHEADE